MGFFNKIFGGLESPKQEPLSRPEEETEQEETIKEEEREERRQPRKERKVASEIKGGRFRPKGGMREPERSKTEVAASAPKLVAPESRESRGKPEEEQTEQEIKLSVSTWVEAIIGKTIQRDAEQVIQKYFCLPGKNFKETAEMNPEQVVRAYANFLMEYKGHDPRQALDFAKDKIRKITGVEVNIPYLVDENLAVSIEAKMRELKKDPSFIPLDEELQKIQGRAKVNSRNHGVANGQRRAKVLTKAGEVAARQISDTGQVGRTPEVRGEENTPPKVLAGSLEQVIVKDRREEEASAVETVPRQPRAADRAERQDTLEEMMPGLASKFGEALASDWDKNVKGGVAPDGQVKLELGEARVGNKRKPVIIKEKGEKKNGRAARRLKIEELKEADYGDEAGTTEPVENEKNEGFFEREKKENQPLNRMGDAWEEATGKAKKK